MCVTFNNIKIPTGNEIKILGLIFNSKFKFKKHCLYIRKKLVGRLNIIKFLASRHSFVHPTILINIVRSLLLSSIDYGLPIYGYYAGIELKKLYAPYHMAVRRSLRAFPTSSTKSILAEFGKPHINERLEINTLRLITKVYLGSNPNLLNDIRSATRKKRTSKFLSTIHLILKYVDELDIHLSPKRSKISKHPPWALDSSVIEDKLMTWNKASTNYEVYKQEISIQKDGNSFTPMGQKIPTTPHMQWFPRPVTDHVFQR